MGNYIMEHIYQHSGQQIIDTNSLHIYRDFPQGSRDNLYRSKCYLWWMGRSSSIWSRECFKWIRDQWQLGTQELSHNWPTKKATRAEIITIRRMPV